MLRGIHVRKNLFFLILLIAFFLSGSAGVSAWAGELKNISTYYATIYYPENRLLIEFAEKIKRQSSVLNPDVAKAEKSVKEDLDRIVFRVKTLLDMYPVNFRFTIRIYRDYESLKVAYRESGLIGSSPIAFYSSSTETIYLTVEKLNGGILAHEIAHAVINTYFDTPPPAKMQEILSQYVDKHIWD